MRMMNLFVGVIVGAAVTNFLYEKVRKNFTLEVKKNERSL